MVLTGLPKEGWGLDSPLSAAEHCLLTEYGHETVARAFHSREVIYWPDVFEMLWCVPFCELQPRTGLGTRPKVR